jgi:hypothetical protein
MSFFEKLGHERRAHDEAFLEARLAHEVGQRPAQDEVERAMAEAKREREQQRRYYLDSGCGQYVRALVEHLRSLGRSPEVSGYIFGARISWRMDPRFSAQFDELATREKLTSSYNRCRIDVAMGVDGTLAVDDQKVTLPEWRNDRGAIDRAFSYAYEHPQMFLEIGPSSPPDVLTCGDTSSDNQNFLNG